MKRYCQFCGSGTDYISAKPVFCCKCGKPFEAIASAPPVPTSSPAPIHTHASLPIRRHRRDDDYEDAERETTFDPNDLSGLAVEVVGTAESRRRVTVEQVAGTKPIGVPIRDIPKTIDKKAIFHEMLPNINAKAE